MHARLRLIAATSLLLPLAGCFIQTKKDANGKESNVDIQTPLGGMSVKTDNAAVAAKLGLPIYPGAMPEQKKDNDESSADVNMNFGPFHLRVLAQGYTSTDSPDKVRAFYQKALAQYGDVIECQGKQPVNGSASHTAQGLTCDNDNHISVSDDKKKAIKFDSNEVELKAGSKSRQHIVGYEMKDGRTRFALVALELPSDNEDSKQAN
ncbi:hypothetical protein [Terriglobus roseus]|uniref:Uncharacterized protein n=1 Tax=Terriglobus roseus TaxID=392734 RepID=A0A1G7NKS3_9BACT|nr:hypothetical protein [Terriglobus roseus]SDF74566.1 hypothetical protein SAMN05444167_3180 [Terriglobus roseus]